jgi:hypothetical protein
MTPAEASRLHADLVARGIISPPAEIAGPANDNEYDAIADAWASVFDCYDMIRRRMQCGGSGWVPK